MTSQAGLFHDPSSSSVQPGGHPGQPQTGAKTRTYWVAGLGYRATIAQLGELSSAVLRGAVFASLEPEDHPKDLHAVRIMRAGQHIGYLPKCDRQTKATNREVRDLMRAGWHARALIDLVVPGGPDPWSWKVRVQVKVTPPAQAAGTR